MNKKSSYQKLLKINEAARDERLTAHDNLVFGRLVWRVNLTTGKCFPSIGLIAEELSMTDRGVSKCIARLEKNGHLKRIIHRGREKANDYLIPGLNTERVFHKTGTEVPKNRNKGSAQIEKETEKEIEASEEQVPIEGVARTSACCERKSVEEGQFQNKLADAFRGGEQGWVAVMQLPRDTLEDLEARCLNGKMSVEEAVAVASSELGVEVAKL
ncbi:hypothetical protein FIU89_17040 [Roseovarius sp. THAF27]|uniref:helix-turn-helix domain-containing protein n=1 Tax=Roseovarius sp. THAF27 TaxID=2587850 RepID=UPI00126816B4|nr:helix-turn-helix domain-containing protein [Roseovarius sp. THAF27]QFT82332.1 hypothetical protein FIU89_17040 [Roseovarius sp. THAF27]